MKYIQVIGAKGMLGQAVLRACHAAGNSVVVLPVDVTTVKPNELQAEVVINCAGIVKQRRDLPASEFVRVNAYGAQRLAEMCDESRCKLVQISTDCVFTAPHWHDFIHIESDPPSPVDIYSRSKLAGEVTRVPHLTVRTSFVGHGLRGLIANLLQEKKQTISLNIFWTGCTVDYAARYLIELAEKNVEGLIHIPAPIISRIELVKLLSSKLNLGTIITETNEIAEDRRLGSEQWEKVGMSPVPEFEKQLAEMK